MRVISYSRRYPSSMITGSHAGHDNVNVWELETGLSKLSFQAPPSVLSAVAFSPDGKRLVTGGDEGALNLWDAATGRETLALKAGDAGITALAFSGDGQRLFSFARSSENVSRRQRSRCPLSSPFLSRHKCAEAHARRLHGDLSD